MRKQIATIFFSLITLLGWAQISVSGALDNNQILIGDQAVLKLEAKYPTDYKVREIDLSGVDSIFAQADAQNPDTDPGQLEIMEIGNWDTLVHNGIVTLANKIRLTAWKKGVYYIPPVKFTFQQDKGPTQSKATNQLALMVSTPIEDTQAPDTLQLAPIKDIVAEPLKLQDFFWYIVGALGLAVLGLLWFYILKYRKRKQNAVEEIIIKRPPYEVAMEKLDQLKTDQLWQQGKIKEYQSQLTYIIREYVENRYDVLALESTTDEILRGLKEKDFDESLKDNLKEMLQLADLVKFAKAEPPIERHEELMAFAEEFVQKTKYIPIAEPITNNESTQFSS